MASCGSAFPSSSLLSLAIATNLTSLLSLLLKRIPTVVCPSYSTFNQIPIALILNNAVKVLEKERERERECTCVCVTCTHVRPTDPRGIATQHRDYSYCGHYSYISRIHWTSRRSSEGHEADRGPVGLDAVGPAAPIRNRSLAAGYWSNGRMSTEMRLLQQHNACAMYVPKADASATGAH